MMLDKQDQVECETHGPLQILLVSECPFCFTSLSHGNYNRVNVHVFLNSR